MSRLPRIDYPGAVQYVCIHGVSSEPLFRTSDDFDYLGAVLLEAVTLYSITLHGFCLLPDQAHGIIQTAQGNIVEVMHRVCTKYTMYFNRTYQRKGPLLRGRFLSLVVQPDEHLLRLSRWLHLLPLTLIKDPNPTNRCKLAALRRFQRSSYRTIAKLAQEARPWLTTDLILELSKRFAPCDYSKYVRRAVKIPDQTFDFLMTRARTVIGTPRFVREVSRYLTDSRSNNDVKQVGFFSAGLVSLSPMIVVRTVCELFSATPQDIRRRQRDTFLRPLTAWALSRFANLTQQQIADELSISTSAAISVQLRTLADKAKTMPLIASMMKQLHDVLQAKQESRS